MKTEISKLPFEEMKHNLAVFLQMGRVQLDSDYNEETELLLRLLQRLADDAVHIGSPNLGFRVDDRILFDGMDSRKNWKAEAAMGDPAPSLFVDHFDFRTGRGSLAVHKAIAVARKLDKPANLKEIREVVFAVKGGFAANKCTFFLGRTGTRARLATVESPTPIAGWRIFKADPAALNPVIDLSAVDEYGFLDLDKAQKYTFDFIKIDEPIRLTLVPTAYTGAFDATTQNPGDMAQVSIDDDNRFWHSTVLKVTQATSITYKLPVVRDLSHTRKLILAAKTGSGAAPTYNVTITDATLGGASVTLAVAAVVTVGAWEIRSFTLPQAGIDWSKVKSLKWGGLTPASTYFFSSVLVEMKLDGNLVIMGGDGTSDGAGRFYGDGLAAIKEAHETYFSQRDLPEADPTALAPPANGKCRTDLAYLDLWERPITYIEDPDIREIALEGPDTCTRTQLVAQTRLLKGAEVNIGAQPQAPWVDFDALPRIGKGTLSTKDNPGAVVDPCADPCEPNVAGTFLGEDNRLFRLEIHRCGNIGPAADPNTAVFKWSRENGAVAAPLIANAEIGDFSIQVEKPELFRPGDLIEISDDLIDLTTGPFEDRTQHWCHQMGEMRRISAINLQDRRISWQDAGSTDPELHAALVHSFYLAYHPKVRRWDALLPVTVGNVVLADGVVIEFGGSDMRPGDYWVFTTRVVDRSVQRLIDAPPRGTRHRYFPLATIMRCNNAGVETLTIDDLRPTFDPLTRLKGSDVAFDPGECMQEDPNWEQVQDVQQAIDALCRTDVAVDLKEHNKYVHGYGVVCGLKLRCHPNRALGQVILGPGYALDCEGRRIKVRGDIVFDLVDEANKNQLLTAGSGHVCLTIARGVAQEAKIDVEKLIPQSFWDSVLEGTLLKDFFTDYIQSFLLFLGLNFLPIPATAVPAPQNHKRLVSFLNLLFQLLNPATARYVFLSTTEDKLLFDFYTDLKNHIASKTFCAMFDNVSPFPDYPYPSAQVHPVANYAAPGIETAFGLFHFHHRVRLHPTLPFAYTCGTGNRIDVFDLNTRELKESLVFPGGQNIEVQDVAFSADGKSMYAVGILNNQDSVFATATIGANQSHIFGATTVVCDILFVRLGTHASKPNTLYAIGKSTVAAKRGLFVFNPANIPLVPTPSVPFHATGLLEISTDGATAFAAENMTNLNGPPATSFGRIRSINLNNLTQAPVAYDCTGDDFQNDVLFFDNNIFITGDPKVGHVKTLRRFAIGGGAPLSETDVKANTATRLSVLPNGDFLLVTLADHHKMARVNLTTNALDATFRVPLQLYPFDVVTSAARSEVYALNYLSCTLSVININVVFGATPLPYTQEPPPTLSAYRNAIIQAYKDVMGKFLQYLKDGFCDEFLIKCPECGPNDKVYLGCVEIQNGKVYNICNFEKRRYVKSIKNWEYWLSTVPILPILKQAFAKFCCKVL